MYLLSLEEREITMSQDTRRLFKTFSILFNAISVIIIIRLLSQFRLGYVELFVLIEDIGIALCFILLIVNHKKIESVIGLPEFSAYVKPFMIGAILMILGNASRWIAAYFLVDTLYMVAFFAYEAMHIIGSFLLIIAWLRLLKYGKCVSGEIRNKMTYGLKFGPVFLIIGTLVYLSFTVTYTVENIVLLITQGTRLLNADIDLIFLVIIYVVNPFILGFGYSGEGFCVNFIPRIEALQYGQQTNTGNSPSPMFGQPSADPQSQFQHQPQFGTESDICPQCGVKYAPDSQFCQNCGHQKH